MAGFFMKTPKGHIVHIRGRKLLPDEQKQLLAELLDRAYEQASEPIPETLRFIDCPECFSEMVQNTIGEWVCLGCEGAKE